MLKNDAENKELNGPWLAQGSTLGRCGLKVAQILATSGLMPSSSTCPRPRGGAADVLDLFSCQGRHGVDCVCFLSKKQCFLIGPKSIKNL